MKGGMKNNATSVHRGITEGFGAEALEMPQEIVPGFWRAATKKELVQKPCRKKTFCRGGLNGDQMTGVI